MLHAVSADTRVRGQRKAYLERIALRSVLLPVVSAPRDGCQDIIDVGQTCLLAHDLEIDVTLALSFSPTSDVPVLRLLAAREDLEHMGIPVRQ
jgi:hypothetical protein